MSTAGIFNSSNIAPQEIAPRFAQMVYRKMPRGSAPLTAMSARLATNIIHDTRVVWGEKYNMVNKFVLSAAMGPAQRGQVTTLEATGTDYVMENQVFMNMTTGEHIFIVSGDGRTWNVRRGFGDTIPRPAAAGQMFHYLFTAFEESSLRPTGVTRTHREFYNLTQIHRHGWAISGTAKEIAMKRGFDVSKLAASKREAYVMHAEDRERVLLFGRRSSSVYKGQPLRTSAGMLQMIEEHAPQNIKVMQGGMFSFDMLENVLQPMTAVVTDGVNENDRLVLCGPTALAALNKMLRKMPNIHWDLSPNASGIHVGMSFSGFSTTFGKFVLMEHPMFAQMQELSSAAMIVDLSSLKWHYLGGRSDVMETYNSDVNKSGVKQDMGIDAEGGSVLSEYTVEFGAPEACGMLYNLCNPMCDTCEIMPNTSVAEFKIDKTCFMGTVKPGDVITMSITAQVADGTEISIMTPTGISVITINGGVGTATWQVPSVVTPETSLVFAVENATGYDVMWKSLSAAACVAASCEPGVAVPDSPCGDAVGAHPDGVHPE